MKKTILFLFNKEVTYLPPFMSILDCLSEDYSLKVISRETKSGRERLQTLYKNKDVAFLETTNRKEGSSFALQAIEKLRKTFYFITKFHGEAIRLIETTPHDVLWVIHEDTVNEFRRVLVGKKYLISIYELNDHRIGFLKRNKAVIGNAQEVIVPEYNRACILRVWLQLMRTPTVIPNKPSSHPLKRNIPNAYSGQLEGKKVILYQGGISRKRNLDKVCEAVRELPEYTIVLMGKGDATYINELKKKNPRLIHISFIMPPEHLFVTSYAHIAIVKYDYVVLNAIFCAPNKTWEYTGFGIPLLCNNIPGLQYTVGSYQAGVCTDMDDTEEIKKAIIEIDKNYEQYSRNAKKFYDSFDVKGSLIELARRNV